jgi:hypothetical protein
MFGGSAMADETRKKIWFITPSYKTLFYLDDGGEIEGVVNGKKRRFVCRYLDEYHVEIGGSVYHICEFAERMAMVGQTYWPVAKEESDDHNK